MPVSGPKAGLAVAVNLHCNKRLGAYSISSSAIVSSDGGTVSAADQSYLTKRLTGDRATMLRPDDRNAAQCRFAMLIASDRAPTKTRVKAHVASRLNQFRDTNLRPR
jgi:hypothetical protein